MTPITYLLGACAQTDSHVYADAMVEDDGTVSGWTVRRYEHPGYVYLRHHGFGSPKGWVKQEWQPGMGEADITRLLDETTFASAESAQDYALGSGMVRPYPIPQSFTPKPHYSNDGQ